MRISILFGLLLSLTANATSPANPRVAIYPVAGSEAEARAQRYVGEIQITATQISLLMGGKTYTYPLENGACFGAVIASGCRYTPNDKRGVYITTENRCVREGGRIDQFKFSQGSYAVSYFHSADQPPCPAVMK